jgi:DNA-binding NtrC family response regulator
VDGHFRADLYYRLGVFSIELPPLRQRHGDIEVLGRFFLDSLARQHGMPAKQFTPEALDALRNYAWPGNVRELKNAIEGALIVADGELIRPEHVIVRRRASVPTPMVEGNPVAVIRIPETGLSMDDAEKQLIEATMKLTKGNLSRTARMLGVSRPTILRKLDRYGIRRRAE